MALTSTVVQRLDDVWHCSQLMMRQDSQNTSRSMCDDGSSQRQTAAVAAAAAAAAAADDDDLLTRSWKM